MLFRPPWWTFKIMKQVPKASKKNIQRLKTQNLFFFPFSWCHFTLLGSGSDDPIPIRNTSLTEGLPTSEDIKETAVHLTLESSLPTHCLR